VGWADSAGWALTAGGADGTATAPGAVVSRLRRFGRKLLGCGDRRGRSRAVGTGLQLSHGAALHLEQPLQIANAALKLRQALVRFLERLRTAGEFLLEGMQTRLGARVLAAVAARNLDLVAGFARRGRLVDLRHDPAGAFLRRLVGLSRRPGTRCGRKAAPVGLEIGRLGTQFATRLGAIDRPDRFG